MLNAHGLSKKLAILGLCLAILASGMLPAMAAPARLAGATYLVNSAADTPDIDPSDGICADSNGQCTLRAAIMQANFTTDPDTITLPSGIYLLTRPGYDDTALVGDLDITHPLTIQGAGSAATIVDGNSTVTNDRVFHLLASAGSVSLSSLTIRHGSVPTTGVGGLSHGGGILVDDSGFSSIGLHLSDVVLEDNTALTGGGLYAFRGTIDLQNTIIRANVAGGEGGGIYATFGSALSLRDSHVYGNNANSGGGGVSLDRVLDARIERSEIYSNTASGRGGGVSLAGIFNARIERSEIYSNTVSGTGGGIAHNPTFDYPNNLLTLVDSNLHDNFAGFGGGAINADSTLILSRTVLNANHAVNRGGGIYTYLENGDTLSLQESTLSRNTAQFGGAINYEGNYSGMLTLVNSTLSGNSVTHDGGGIYAAGSARLLLRNATVAGNQAVRPFNQLHPVRGGGVFITETAGVVAQNSLIADNLSGNTITPPNRDDCFGPLHSLGYNLIETTTNCLIGGTPLGNVTGQDPVLGPLQNNGGSTLTQAPLSGSSAIDRGDNTTCPAVDQRGFHRPIGSMCDIGAVEVGPYVFLPLVLR